MPSVLRSCLLAGLLCAIPSGVILVAADQRAPRPPMPRVEFVQRLAYFVGTWNTVQESPQHPEAREEGTIVWRFFPGGFTLLGWRDALDANGSPRNELIVFDYKPEGAWAPEGDAKTDAYHWYTVTRGGASTTPLRFSLRDTAWMSNTDGPHARLRRTLTQVSPNSYTFVVEKSEDGVAWTMVSELRASRVLEP